MQGLGLLSLRCIVGLVFIAHGLPKLFPLWGSSPRAAAAVFEAAGLSPAYPVTVATGIVEVFGGALLVAGAFTFWVALLLVLNNVAVGLKLHLPHGFFLNWSLEPGVGHGYEFTLVLVSALACLMLAGPGMLSIDGQRARVAATMKLSRARLRAGKI